MGPTRQLPIACALVLALEMAGPCGAEQEPSSTDGDWWRGPLANRNQFPLALLFISLGPERAAALPKGDLGFRLNLDYSNIIVSQAEAEDVLILDMEYLSAELAVRAGLGAGFEVGARLPLYTLYGGFLDGFISDYHRALGLPDSVRSRTPNGLFQYEYQVDATTVLGRSNGGTAVGNLTLSVKKALTQSRNEIAVRAAVKLPTGSRKNLTSSGEMDFGAGLALSRVGRRFGGYLNLDYNVLGDADLLDTRSHVLLIGAFDWRFRDRWALLAQYEQLSPFIEGRLPLLTRRGRQIVLGLQWRRSDRFRFEWRFTEDISAPAPDFTVGFQIAVHRKANRNPGR